MISSESTTTSYSLWLIKLEFVANVDTLVTIILLSMIWPLLHEQTILKPPLLLINSMRVSTASNKLSDYIH